MDMKFTLRPGHDGITGTLNYGKGVLVLQDELKDGVIETDHPLKQHILSALRGEHGLVFDVAAIVDGEEKPVDRPEVQAPVPQSPQNLESVTAQHGSNEGYELLSVDELKLIAQNSGLATDAKATKEQIIQIIEQHEAEVVAERDA